MGEKCYTCGKGKLARKKVNYSLYGFDLGRFEALVCDRCEEVFFVESESRKMTAKAKKLGLWGLEAKTKVGTSGSTLDIRLPKRIIDFMKLKKGREIAIHPENKKRLVVELT